MGTALRRREANFITVVQHIVNGNDVLLPDHQTLPFQSGMFCAACAAAVEIRTEPNPAPSLDTQFLWEQQRQPQCHLLVADRCSTLNRGVKPR